jgi:succinate-acetate transporter protein
MKNVWRVIKKVIGIICLIWGVLGLYTWLTTLSLRDTSFAIWSFIGLSVWFVLAYFLLRERQK